MSLRYCGSLHHGGPKDSVNLENIFMEYLITNWKRCSERLDLPCKALYTAPTVHCLDLDATHSGRISATESSLPGPRYQSDMFC